MILKIKTIFFVQVAGRGGSTEVDTEILFDKYGIPYLNGRRLKGLLREACEITANKLKIKEDYLHKLFGKGNSPAIIEINNAYIENHNTISQNIQQLNENNSTKAYQKLSKTDVIEYFTTIVDSTAIEREIINNGNESTGVAKEYSLRKIRALNPGITFMLEIDDTELTDFEKNLIQLATIEWKHIGVRRNKTGFINTSVNNLIWSAENVTKIINELQASKNDTHLRKNSALALPSINEKDVQIKSIDLIFKATSNIIVPSTGGDPNTVFTDKILSGSLLRGVVAYKLIKKYKLQNAHENVLFRELVLSKKVKYSFGFPYVNNRRFTVLSKHLQYEKGKNSDILLNLFDAENIDKNLKQRTIFTNEYEKYDVLTDLNFHHARSNEKEQIAGKNVGGEIFYYESIAKGTSFIYTITAPESYISLIKELIPIHSVIKVGRSKLTEYGKLQLEKTVENNSSKYTNKSIEEKNKTENTYILKCNSPLILFNRYGEAIINKDILLEYLKEQIKLVDIKDIIGSSISTTEVEIHNRQWKAKGIKYISYAVGSAFKISTQYKLSSDALLQLGELTELGFGEIEIIEELEQKDSITLSNINNEDELQTIECAQFDNIYKSHLKKKRDEIIKNSAIINISNKFNNNEEEMKKYIEFSTTASSNIANKISSLNENELTEYLEGIKTKQLGKKLQNIDHFDIIKCSSKNNIKLSSYIDEFKKIETFDDYVLYWTTYFNYLKSLIKSNKR